MKSIFVKIVGHKMKMVDFEGGLSFGFNGMFILK